MVFGRFTDLLALCVARVINGHQDWYIKEEGSITPEDVKRVIKEQRTTIYTA